METGSPFNSKIIIAAGVGVLVIIVVALIVLSQRPSSSVTGTTIPTPTVSDLLPTEIPNNGQPTASPLDNQPLLMGTANVEVTRPANWIVTKDDESYGENILLKPKGTATQSISIITEPNVSAATLSNHTSLFEKLGYTKTARTIQGNPAVVYKGVLPNPDSKDPAKPEILQNVVIFVNTPSKVYTINYHYISATQDSGVESKLEEIVSSIKLK